MIKLYGRPENQPMKLPFPRFTLRRLLAIVLMMGTVIWPGIAGERTRLNKARFHTDFHAAGFPVYHQGDFAQSPEWVPFWPVYWRSLLGLPWDWRYQCVPGGIHRNVACKHDIPELIVRDDGGNFHGFKLSLLQNVLEGKPTSQR
jgi:hypothetical protein